LGAEPLSILHMLSYHLYTGPAEPVLQLAREQRRAGHNARLAVDSVRSGDLIEKAAGYGVPVEDRLALSVKAGPILHLRDILALKRMWADDGIDILHAHRSHDHTLAALARPRRAAGTRLVRTLHTESSLGHSRAWQLRRADGLITVARRFRRDLLERNYLPADLIIAVEGAVDCELFSPGPATGQVREAAGVDIAAPVAGIVARMKTGRGHGGLLDAFEIVSEKLPAARLLIAGRGELESDLKRRVGAGDLSDKVIFLGYRRDLPDVYRSLDLEVTMAPGNDGTCRAALQAMACGVPVLATDRGALPEIVEDGKTGWVVPAGDNETLAKVLIEALSDRERCAQMGQIAAERARVRFRLEKQAIEIEKLYRRVLDR